MTLDLLEGHLVRVLWRSEESGYAVVKVRSAEGELTAVGSLGALAVEEDGEGPFLTLEGRWELHPAHGRQFKVQAYLQASPRTLEGMKLYLASSAVHGIGPRLADRIVDHFGMKTLSVLAEAPERLREVPGIGPAKAESIATQWRADEEGRALSVLLKGLGLSARQQERIKQRYGERTAWVLSREPYRLAEEIPGVGFRTADQLARSQGLPEDDPARVRAAVLHVLEAQAGEGHCFVPRAEVPRLVAALGVPTTGLDAAVEAAVATGRAAAEGERLWTRGLLGAERMVAWELRRRAAPSEEDVREEVVRAALAEGVVLDEDQQRAVEVALRGGVVVVTGGPGTGKTTLVRVLVRAVRERGQQWRLASPTGRAARRLEEATGVTASTVHRLLEYNPSEGGFQRTIGRPIEGEGLVVDEASMVDLPLMSALLRALPEPPFALVLVGDADQLPSVGPGQVLRDVIASGEVPVVRLTRIHRQGTDSGIVTAAAEIRAGRVPASGEIRGLDDLFLLPRDDPEQARQTLETVLAERLPQRGFDPLEDVQVLTPTRKGALGTEALNRLLQARLNPHAPGRRHGDRELRVGDRVICTRNRYDVEIFNGDVGRVLSIEDRGLRIDFDGRVVPWASDELILLDLAYALTVHKAQGSEYPAVVLVLHPAHGIMLRRNLFYTAITRAKRFLCVIGGPSGWRRAVERTGGDERHTALAERLREVEVWEEEDLDADLFELG